MERVMYTLASPVGGRLCVEPLLGGDIVLGRFCACPPHCEHKRGNGARDHPSPTGGEGNGDWGIGKGDNTLRLVAAGWPPIEA